MPSQGAACSNTFCKRARLQHRHWRVENGFGWIIVVDSGGFIRRGVGLDSATRTYIRPMMLR